MEFVWKSDGESERGERHMLSKFGFKGMDAESCFDDPEFESVYFPILDTMETPKGIMDKAEEMVNELLHMHHIPNARKMELYLNALVKVDPVKNKMGICVKISDYDSLEDHIAEKKLIIWRGSPLYGEFKSYFMAQVEKRLFGE